MGRRYERKRTEVQDNIKENSRIKTDRGILKNEFSILSSLNSLLSELEDEAQDAVRSVEVVGEQEFSRLEDERKTNESEKLALVGVIEEEISKLQKGMATLNEMGSSMFGKQSIEQAKKKYSQQADDYVKLLKELGRDIDKDITTETTEAKEIANIPVDNTAHLIKENCSTYLMSKNIVNKVDFGNLDVKTARDITLAVQETKAMFPDLQLKFVGSIQARNAHIERSLIDMYMKVIRQENPDVSEALLSKLVQKQVASDMQALQPSDSTIGESLNVHFVDDAFDKIFADMSGITVNETYGGSYEYFIATRKSDVESGWKPQNCYSPKATVDHELGHQIAALIDAHNDSVIKNMYSIFEKLGADKRTKVLSGYAGTNIYEFIAEAWSEFRNNPQCRFCASTVAKRLIKLYGDKTL